MTFFNTLKPIALTCLIALACVLRYGPAAASKVETLIVAGGCFWCVESDFEKVPGVVGAMSGFTGGTAKTATYRQVSTGGTGHFEAVQITFDPDVVTRETLLVMFFRSVDPTDAGGQFCDRGDSYRSAIFVSDKTEQAIAKRVKAQAQSDLGMVIVTPILSKTKFYPADASHQDYYKGTKLVLTRFGPKRQSSAYKRYRKACGRDVRVRELWGAAAAFTGS